MDTLQIQNMQLEAAKEELQPYADMSRQYGLTLTEADITDLIEFRTEALRNTGRIEFGGEILQKLIQTFCKSPYVDQENFVAVLNELQESFYELKSESKEEFSDDELISFMYTIFNDEAKGSAELLTTILIENFHRLFQDPDIGR